MEQIKDIMKNIVSCVASQTTNIDKADPKELSEAMDMIKDLAMAEYYCQITKAMENPENEYGVDYDENGRIRKGYNSSRMAMNGRRGYDDADPRYTMDDEMRTPYTHNGGTTPRYGYTERMAGGRYENARRGYEEIHDMSSLNKIFDIIEEDMKELKPTMSASDMSTAKQRLITLANMM